MEGKKDGNAHGRKHGGLEQLARQLGIHVGRDTLRSADARRDELLARVLDRLCGSQVNTSGTARESAD